MASEHKDLKKIKSLIKIMKDNDLIEVEIKTGDEKIMLKRSDPNQIVTAAQTMMPAAQVLAAPIAPAASSETASAADDNLVEIVSPIVGTFYTAPSPDSDNFVEINSKVSPKTVVCIVEAMKVMNEIKADATGTIVEILVESGQAVEFGQPLYKVKP